MEVYFDEKGDKIVRTVSTGNVRITTKDCKTGTAKRAEYYDADQRVVLIGDARVWQEDNVVTGERITIYLAEDRSVVEGGRVRGRVFYPKREDAAGRRKPPAGQHAREDGVEGLVAQGLIKRFRNRVVVDGVDVDIQRGEVVGLLGPNGAGKTTSFYMMVGLLRPEGGRIFLEGEDMTDLPMYLRCRRGMGYLPQESSVFRKLTVEENLLAILEQLDLRSKSGRRACACCWPSST